MVVISPGRELCCKPSALIDGISPVQSTRGDLHFFFRPSPNAVTKMFTGISISRNRPSLPLVLIVKILRLSRVKRRSIN
jgi:hypothetical protein